MSLDIERPARSLRQRAAKIGDGWGVRRTRRPIRRRLSPALSGRARGGQVSFSCPAGDLSAWSFGGQVAHGDRIGGFSPPCPLCRPCFARGQWWSDGGHLLRRSPPRCPVLRFALRRLGHGEIRDRASEQRPADEAGPPLFQLDDPAPGPAERWKALRRPLPGAAEAPGRGGSGEAWQAGEARSHRAFPSRRTISR